MSLNLFQVSVPSLLRQRKFQKYNRVLWIINLYLDNLHAVTYFFKCCILKKVAFSMKAYIFAHVSF